jgi:RimJ/RimL family protein N-acetyltransferase
MKPFELSTEKEGLVLRQLSSEADDAAYFAAIDLNRDYLSQFSDKTVAKYSDLNAVTDARVNPADPNELRMGIWNADSLVGSMNLTPDKYGSAELDYWLDPLRADQDYAVFTTTALARYAVRKYSIVYAYAANDNETNTTVFERAGFQFLAKEVGHTIFGLTGIVKPTSKPITEQLPNESKSPSPDLNTFIELPNRKDALRAKDKDNLTVFLAFGLAKKLYRCPCCNGGIEIGSSHVIMSRVQMSKRYTHHHIDFDCAKEKILPTLRDIQTIKSADASATAVNARRRKYRNKHRED